MAAIIDIDKGWTRIAKELKTLNNTIVKVGILQKDGGKKGKLPDLVQYASANEFGTSKIPSRPFMRQAFEKNSAEITQKTKGLKNRVFRGADTAEIACKKIGVWYKGQIQKEIRSGNFKPNAPATIRAKTVRGKKGTTPLIDTGRMIQSINFELDKKGIGGK